MRKRKACLQAGFVVLLFLSIMSCSGSGSGSATYTLSGTLTKDVGVVDGSFGYVKLVVHGGAGDAEALYWARSSAFVSGVATYSITNIAEGSYTGYAFIDVDDDAAGDETSMPDDGDFATDGGGDFTINSDQVADLPDAAWIVIGGI